MVLIQSVMVQIQPVMIQMRSDTVHLARRGFQDCAVYCLLPPSLVYFAVLQPGLFSIFCLIHFVSYTVQPPGPTSVNYLRHLLICHCLQCNHSCHQFVAKPTWMSFISGLGYFVSWGNYNDHTCFPLLDAVSELLTTAPAHVNKCM